MHIKTEFRQDPPAPPSPLSHTALLDRAYNADIDERLAFANFLYTQLQPLLADDAKFSRKIDTLRQAAVEVNQQMAQMEFSSLCPDCAADPRRGGCCSLYMAGETDALQLLLNMLAGITVEQVRDDGRECCYLGEEGCILLFKPMFCLNYLCEGIQKGCAPAALTELEKRTGHLLQLQFQLEQELLELVRRKVAIKR